MEILLLSHIVGGVITGIVSLGALITLVKNKDLLYPFFSKSIALLALLQVITGSLMLLFSQNSSLSMYCTRIGIYMGVIVFLEVVLFMRTKNYILYPKKSVVYALSMCCLLIASTVVASSLS